MFIRLPPSLRPSPQPVGHFLKVSRTGAIIQDIRTDNTTATHALTSVKEYGGVLYLGSLDNNFVGIVSVDDINQFTHGD
jgi:hypothetical protein